ncbi:hypothetical protein [Weissella diestrammenae]|nr:hypothetical protein [Weissella diestrammenae]
MKPERDEFGLKKQKTHKPNYFASWFALILSIIALIVELYY